LIEIPPLRERKDDLPLLLDYFLDETSSSLNKKKPTPPPELHALLATYDFPGNVRELRAMVHNAVSMHSSHKLSMKSFRQSIGQTTASSNILDSQPDENEALLLFGNKLPTLKAAADQLVKEAMQRAGNNQTIAAGLLGIAQSSLNRRLKNLKKS
jgi:DNA-binding NtrC family response regulator